MTATLGYFSISTGEHERLRLKSFSARTKGISATLTIVIETDDTFALAHALKELGAIQLAQAEAAKSKPRRKQLALPAPDGNGA